MQAKRKRDQRKLVSLLGPLAAPNERGNTLRWGKIWSNSRSANPARSSPGSKLGSTFITILASGKDDEKAGLKRGEFVASIDILSECRF